MENSKYTQEDIDAYNSRAIEEEGHEFEAWMKLQSLRHGRDVATVHRQAQIKNAAEKTSIKINDRVRFRVGRDKDGAITFRPSYYNPNGEVLRLTGYVKAINKSTVQVHVGERSFDINPADLWIVKSEHNTDVEIPKELKSVPTERLLSMRNQTYTGHSAFHTGTYFTAEQIYAELATREHVPTKAEKRFFKNLK